MERSLVEVAQAMLDAEAAFLTALGAAIPPLNERDCRTVLFHYMRRKGRAFMPYSPRLAIKMTFYLMPHEEDGTPVSLDPRGLDDIPEGMPLADIEALLNKGMIGAHMTSGAYWIVRRNGRTQTWKKRPGFRIPIKAGLNSYGSLEDTNLHAYRIINKLL